MGNAITFVNGVLQALPVNKATVTIGGVFAIIILIGLSAFFSSSEIAMFSLAKHRVDSLVEEGVPGAETVQSLKNDPHRLLITILVGNNIVNIAMSSLSTGLLVYIGFGQGEAVAIATFGITALVLLFGESAPKSYAVENTESWSLRIARPLKISEYVLLPLVVIFDRLTRIVNRITGGRSAIETSYVTRDEIQDLIQTGEREGVIEEDEREMLDRIFRFNQTIAKEVMTPRLDMTAVPKDATLDEAIETCIQSDHERVPVYDGNLDNVIGIVNIRDLVREQFYGEGGGDLADIVQPTLHVPESKNVDELLTEIQDNRLQMVIVIDEFGTTEGLITLEDMVEEIVGDILEDDEEEAFEFINERETLVRGEVNIDEVNEVLELDLPEGEEFETLAGFIFNRAGRLVEEGEEIEYDSVMIRIEQVDNTRIMKARITVDNTDDESEAEAEIDPSNAS
ncbi:HlyC/CorC family transporter [Halogeometricum borinquense]|uniref:CBS domain-containing protein n=2 Tax=Halogeometricum borinquense TaxID=60847 RepID=E4NMI1_HALBP|nr:hemolysin family protein [Halogeometricum borinquense]ADQ68479.1 CBS domain-containing protein [Halogeometricum borinquense DSM 11551]ELY27877.1 cbs domain-containing protein [Halogeometricum borinquense DSM 11551]QIB72997.1 HlyC/CorC family transporter [Halogeometricum borinquense]QIQ77635.1 HlyC/CorC family transporter [Halogeometricum borinquense]RYJ14990.1 HlyC/CorC family transporter [Halogeometricum borinquense]